jgi:outer membrane protein assembly factor BamB
MRRLLFATLLVATVACGRDTSNASEPDAGAGKLDASVDARAPVDAGAKLGAFCLPGLKPFPLPEPSAPLPVEPKVLWSKPIATGDAARHYGFAVSGDRIAVSDEGNVWIRDLDGEPVAKISDRTALSITGAVGDGKGNFYYGADHVVSVDRDGKTRWVYQFGPLAVPSEHGYTASLVVAPDGAIYFGASDKYVHAVSTDTGKLLWKTAYEPGLSGNGIGAATNAVGDVVFVDWVGYHRKTGEALGVFLNDGIPAGVSRINSRYDLNLWQPMNYTAVADACGTTLLQRERTPMSRFYFGFNDETIVKYETQNPDGTYRRFAFVEGQNHLPNSATREVDWVPIAVGADGLTYAISGDGTQSSLVTLKRDMTEIFRLPVGAPLSLYAALLDDGRLYLDTYNTTTKARVLVAIQTTSPGLARTAWPSIQGDNTNSGWVGPWPRY